VYEFNKHVDRIFINIFNDPQTKYEFENSWRNPNKKHVDGPDFSEEETEEEIRRKYIEEKKRFMRRNTSSEDEVELDNDNSDLD